MMSKPLLKGVSLLIASALGTPSLASIRDTLGPLHDPAAVSRLQREALSAPSLTSPRYRMGLKSPLLATPLLAMEPNSWCGRLYGHFQKGDAHIQKIADDPLFQKDLRRLEKYFGFYRYGPYRRTTQAEATAAFRELLRQPARAIALTIATTVGPKFESGMWMRDIDREIAQQDPPVEGIAIFALRDLIIERAMEAALARHPTIFMAGRSFAIKDKGGKETLRQEMRGWINPPLMRYIEKRLWKKQPGSRLRGDRMAARLEVFDRHQASNRSAPRSEVLSLETAEQEQPPLYLPAPRFPEPNTGQEASILAMTKPDFSGERALAGLLRRHQEQIALFSVEQLKSELRALLAPTPAQEKTLKDRQGLADVIGNKCTILMSETIAYYRPKLEKREPHIEDLFRAAARIWLLIARLSHEIPPPGREREDVWRWIQPSPDRDAHDPLSNERPRHHPTMGRFTDLSDDRWDAGSAVLHARWGVGYLLDSGKTPRVRFPGQPDQGYNRQDLTPVLLMGQMSARLSREAPLLPKIDAAIEQGSLKPLAVRNVKKNIPDHVFLWSDGPKVLAALSQSKTTRRPARTLLDRLQEALQQGFSLAVIGQASGLQKHDVAAFDRSQALSRAKQLILSAGLRKLERSIRPFPPMSFSLLDIQRLELRFRQYPLQPLQQVPHVFQRAFNEVLKSAVTAGYTASRLSLAAGLSDSAVADSLNGQRIQKKSVEALLQVLRAWSQTPEAPRLPSFKDQAEKRLKYPREDLYDLTEMAQALGKSVQRLSDLIHAKRLRPDQSLWLKDRRGFHYFLKSRLTHYISRFAPDQYPDAYTLEALAKKLDCSAPRLKREIDKRIIRPRKVIGFAARPEYVVPPEDMEKFRALLHPEELRVSTTAAGRMLRVSRSVIVWVAEEQGIALITETKGSRTHQSLQRADLARIRENLPQKPHRFLRTLQKTARRLGVVPETLDSLAPDLEVKHQSRVFKYFDSRTFPMRGGRAAVWEWIKARRELSRAA